MCSVLVTRYDTIKHKCREVAADTTDTDQEPSQQSDPFVPPWSATRPIEDVARSYSFQADWLSRPHGGSSFSK